MVTIKSVIELPVAVNDFLLDEARKNRRTKQGPTNKDGIITEVLTNYFITKTEGGK